MYDLNDAQPQMLPVGDLLPDGTFAKIRMTLSPGGVDAFDIGGETFVVQGEPIRDGERLVWTIEARPA